MNPVLAVAFVLVLWNLIVFALYAIDKRKAKRGARRISEKTLMICTFLLSAPGAVLGMLAVRHKTRHLKFRILVPLALILQVGGELYLLYWFSR